MKSVKECVEAHAPKELQAELTQEFQKRQKDASREAELESVRGAIMELQGMRSSIVDQAELVFKKRGKTATAPKKQEVKTKASQPTAKTPIVESRTALSTPRLTERPALGKTGKANDYTVRNEGSRKKPKYVVLDRDGVEYVAEKWEDVLTATAADKVSDLAPQRTDDTPVTRGEAKDAVDTADVPLTPEQRERTGQFLLDNMGEFKAYEAEELGRAVVAVELSPDLKLTVGNVREQLQRYENQKSNRKKKAMETGLGTNRAQELEEAESATTEPTAATNTKGAKRSVPAYPDKKNPKILRTGDGKYKVTVVMEQTGDVQGKPVYTARNKVYRGNTELQEASDLKDAEEIIEKDRQLQEDQAIKPTTNAPKVVVVKRKKLADNKVFTEEGVEKARKIIADSTKNLNSGFDPALFKALVYIGGAHFEAGIRDFAQWAKEVIEKIGSNVSQENLRKAFDIVSNHPVFQGERAKKGEYYNWEPPTTSAGKYLGAPEGVVDQASLNSMRRRVRSKLVEGEKGRFWYEESAKAVLKLVGGDPILAEKFIQIIAIYSPQATVNVNTTFALRAWDQWNRGVPRNKFKVKTKAQDQKAIDVLYDGKPFDGRKTNSFYANLITHILNTHPEYVVDMQLDASTLSEINKIATIDLWMYRAFGYKRESAGDDKGTGAYSFAENEVRRLVDRLNAELKPGEKQWTSFQVQAAIWTAMKARYEDPSVKKKTWAISIKKGWATLENGKKKLPKGKEAKKQHARLWYEQAMLLSSEKAKKNADEWSADYSTFLKQNTRVVTWETNPSTKLEHPVNGAPAEVKSLFNQEARELILDENGGDSLAAMLGVHLGFIQDGAGAYQGEVNDNNLSHLTPGKEKGEKGFTKDLVRLYARAVQYIYKQDAVPWFRADPRALSTKAGEAKQGFRVINRETGKTLKIYKTLREAQENLQDGYEIRGGPFSRGVILGFPEELSRSEEGKLAERIAEVLGPDSGFTKVDTGEYAVVNFRDDATGVPFVSDEIFLGHVENIASSFNIKEQLDFWAETEYGYVHDWAGDPRGTGIFSQDGTRFPQDLQDWVRARQGEYEQLLERYSGVRPETEVLEGGVERGQELSDELVGLTHWSSTQGLSELDPAMHGTGIAGAERKRKQSDPENWVDRTYYGLDGYTKEPGLGPHMYRTTIPKAKLYDIGKDELGLNKKAQAERMENPFANQYSVLERLIRDAGYEGYTSSTMNGTAAVFTKQSVEPAVSAESMELANTNVELTNYVRSLKKQYGSAQLAKIHLMNLETLTMQQGLALSILNGEINMDRQFESAEDLYYSLEEEVLPGDLREMWEWVEENTDLGKLTGVTVINGATRSSYDPKTNTIRLQSGATASTKLHEIMHALTHGGIQGNTKASQALSVLREQAKRAAVEQGLVEQWQVDMLDGIETSANFNAISHLFEDPVQRDMLYGFINNGEFISSIFGNQGFRDFSRKLKWEKESLWQKFYKIVQGVLEFLSGGKHESMFSQILELTSLISDAEHLGIGEVQEAPPKITPPNSRDEAKKVMQVGTRSTYLKDTMESWKNELERFLRPASDILLDLSPKIHGRLQNVMDFQSIKNQKRYSALAKPFLSFYEKLGKADRIALDFAWNNSNLKENQKLIEGMVPKKALDSMKTLLKELRDRGEDVGIISKDNPFYLPRRVKDVNGLMDELYKDSEYKGMLGNAMKEAEETKGSPLSEAEKSEVITNMLTTGRPSALPTPGASKKRKIPFVTAETYRFYDNSSEALIGHIFEMNEKLSALEFAGRSRRKQEVKSLYAEAKRLEDMPDGPERDAALLKYQERALKIQDIEQSLKDDVSAMVLEDMKDSSAEDQRKVIDILNARMRPRGAHGAIDALRNIGYITTMGNFLSTLTQLGDIPIIFYAHGINADSVKAVGKALGNVYRIIRADIRGQVGTTDAFVDQADFTNALREFSQGNSVTGRMVEMAFKFSGLKYVDLIGKEAFMQAGFAKYKRGGKHDAEFIERFTPMFGDTTAQVLADIKAGKKTQDVLSVLLAELSDWQPITMSQQSQVYMTSGNGRIFYMLKTFTLRATSGALREGMKEIRKGGAKNIAAGVAKVLGLVMLYALAGAGTDEIKDVLRGRDDSFTDTTMDNFWQMFLMNRFALDKGLQGDNLATSLLNSFAFPVRWADGLASDAWALIDEDKEFKLKTAQSIPFVGSLYYSRSEPGVETYTNRKKKEILEKVKENRKDGKSPYTGDVRDMVRKYNESVSRDKWISNDAILRAYKEGGKK